MVTTGDHEVAALFVGGRVPQDTQCVQSGTRMEIGCHHAEMNVICNAAANGVSTRGAWLLVTGEPCTMCSKLIHHAAIERVIVVSGGYAGANGCGYLENHGVEVVRVSDPLIRDWSRLKHPTNRFSAQKPCASLRLSAQIFYNNGVIVMKHLWTCVLLALLFSLAGGLRACSDNRRTAHIVCAGRATHARFIGL